MRRLRAFSAAELTFIFISCLLISHSIFAKDTVDPCKRQPFRGRCPVNDGRQTRSQFVLRYYVRKGECVSYPYGYCSNDQNEPRLFRFKEECEEACLNLESTTADEAVESTVTVGNAVGLLDVGHEATTSGSAMNEEVEETTQKEETYGTSAPIRHGEYKTPKTECQRQRERAGGLIKGGFVPDCTPAGAFQPLQCEPDGKTCFCVNENGIEVANSRCQPEQPKPDCEKIIAAKPMRTNECTGGAESGPCQLSSQRWFYDEESTQCKPFTYSGCGGNGNNYGSEAACQRRCRPADDGAPKCVGGALPLSGANGAPVNCAATACPAGYKCNVIQETHHICCPDAEKSADAGVLDSGMSPALAVSLSRCTQPKNRGPCDRYELRFYYNAETHECKYFFYGGCDGNENNFKQVDDCERTCGRSSKSTTSTTVAETTANVETKTSVTEALSVPPQTETKIVTLFKTTVSELSPAPASTASEVATKPQTVGTERSEKPSTTPYTTTTVAPMTTRAQPRVPEPTLPPQATPRMRLPITTEPLPANSCQHPLDFGHCSGQFIRWYWDAASRICETFTYSGCGGNGNNFNSRGECLGRCHKEVVKPVTLDSVDLVHVCDSDIDIGECGGTFMRYAFDRPTGECRQFKYGGCGGNGNNFATIDDCRLKCLHKKKGGAASLTAAATPQPLPKNICEHEIDSGECTGLFHRFAYDIKSNECRRFDYGGCGGNGNNFATVEDCRTACVKTKCAPELECDARRCQLVRDAHGCPFCSCPPVPRHPPVNTRASLTPALVPAQLRAPCPAFDMDSCTEPCIVFRNRVNCNECVCPVIPTTSRPSVDCAPFNAHACASPCKTFSNRAGCQECVCPVAPSIMPDDRISVPDLLPLPASIQSGRIAQPPAPAAPPAPALPTFASKINDVKKLPPPGSIPFGEFGEKCTQPLDPGPCTNFVQRWHFNPVLAECEPFQYGGCAGNRNHFFTQMECMVHCGRFLPTQPTSVASAAPKLPPQPQLTSATVTTVTTTTTAVPEIDDTCIFAPEPGPCTDYVPRWFFNAQTAKCEQFSYGSCNGNKNNFVEREQCERRCRAEIEQLATNLPTRCTRPHAEGQGVGYAPRWYYNQKNLRCEQFVYRGEGGNDNQFISVEDCERTCKYFSSSTDGAASTPAGEPIFVRPNFSPRPILNDSSGEDRTVPERRKPSTGLSSSNSAESQSFGARNVAAGDSNGVGASQPVELIETEPKSKYPQESIADRPINSEANLPPLGPSMKANIDYSAGKRLSSEDGNSKAFGINIHTPHKDEETQSFSKDNDENNKIWLDERGSSVALAFGDEWTAARIPVCPNSLNAMQYVDGRPVMCLPGKNQCPDKSVCYFNGLDYFCCPNEDDPYDKHVFGGYDGEEVKHGYKDVASPLSIHSIRRSRRAASARDSAVPPISFSLDKVQNSLRFDDKSVQRIASASSLISSRRVSPCLEEARRGSCNEAHLRFFYDINVDRCRLFYYSGCGGNTNNFATEAECERRCKIGAILTSNRDHIITPAAATPAPVAPVVPPGQCPDGEAPLGDPSPVLCGNRSDSIGCPVGYYCRTGPPDVCCPTIASDGNININQLLNGQVERGDVRRKPFVAGAAAVGHDDEHKQQLTGNGKYSDDENGLSSGGPSPASNKNAALGVPANMCQDGSNALEEGGVARQCGTGFDGHELCPRGYYCSINPEQHARLCCPLFIEGSNLGNNLLVPSSIAPYFGIRVANPGEVIDRGSLPSDPKPPKLITPEPRTRPTDIHPADYEDERSILPAPAAHHLNLGVDSSDAHSVAEVAPAVMLQANGSEYDHLIIKNNANQQAKGDLERLNPFWTSDQSLNSMIEAHKPSADDQFDKKLFSRGAGSFNDDPFETLWMRLRSGDGDANAAARAATCRLRPSEGRVCQPGKSTPHSNLQFFYSEKERVCKVFFYRGCGGNANRFSTKRECEQYCANRA